MCYKRPCSVGVSTTYNTKGLISIQGKGSKDTP